MADKEPEKDQRSKVVIFYEQREAAVAHQAVSVFNSRSLELHYDCLDTYIEFP